jgi:hypothetical protein
VGIVRNPNQLRDNAYARGLLTSSLPADTSFEHVINVKLLRDLPERLFGPFILHSAGPRNDRKPVNPGKTCGDLLRHTVSEVFVLSAPQVLERKHG